MNDGKDLEQLVRLIQDTLKDSPNTIIYSNNKLKNASGRKREFDILIETTVNSFTVKIAIECKDYKTAVSVEKIEAFEGKCQRIPDINKKVFVSSKGYQRDAINAAKEFGIELYKVEDIDASKIINWFPIKQLQLRMHLKNFSFGLIATDDELPAFNDSVELNSFEFGGRMVKSISNHISNILLENKSRIWDINISNFLRDLSNTTKEKAINIPFKISLENAYLLANKKKVVIKEIAGSIDTWFEEKDPNIITSKDYSTNDESKAKYVSMDNGKSGTIEVVLTETKKRIFHTDIEGNKAELGLIGIFDPKTDRFIASTTKEEFERGLN